VSGRLAGGTEINPKLSVDVDFVGPIMRTTSGADLSENLLKNKRLA
jgi:hypothetical protein